MTIMQALERAKKLQEAGQRAAGSRAGQSTIPLPGVTTLPIPPGPAPLSKGLGDYPDLKRVSFEVAECERNRILVNESLLGKIVGVGAAYRLLRSRVQHRLGISNWTCIGITSPGPGEGKTVTALNLAISIARENQRPVYLVDLDMRNPSVFRYLGARPMRPIGDFFQEPIPADSVLFSTPVSGLFVSGNLVPVEGASELLAGPRLEELLACIRYRSPNALIIVDLPPVLSTDEALVVAPRTDAMFMVVSEGVTRRDAMTRSLELLSDFEVAGIILNRSSESLGRDYY